MRVVVFWLVCVFALLLSAVSLFDLYMTLTANRDYLAEFPPEFMEMIQGFPEWRRLLWTTSVFLGVIGAVLLTLRKIMAERVFWATAVTMAAGFVGYDLPFGNGIDAYGAGGIIFSAILIGIQMVFALYARWAARHGLIRQTRSSNSGTGYAD